MPHFQIWHKDNAPHGERFFEDGNLMWPDPRFVHVATVQAANLEDAYYETQHLTETGWTSRPERMIYTSRPRSTSVGDVVVDQYGIAHQVMSISFAEVPTVNTDSLIEAAKYVVESLEHCELRPDFVKHLATTLRAALKEVKHDNQESLDPNQEALES